MRDAGDALRLVPGFYYLFFRLWVLIERKKIIKV